MSEDLFTFANSVDSDEMQHDAAFHLGLHCLQKYSFWGPKIQRVKNIIVITIWDLAVPKHVFMESPMKTKHSVYVKVVTPEIAVMFPVTIKDSVSMIAANVTQDGGVSVSYVQIRKLFYPLYNDKFFLLV